MGIPSRRAAGAALVIAGLGALLAGCAGRAVTVRIPAADATPPFSALDVVGANRRLVLFSGEGPQAVELSGEDSVVLIALGEDRDGGVKDLSLFGNAVAVCGDTLGPPAAAESRKSGAFVRRHVHPAPTGTRVPGSRSTRYVLKAAEFRKLCGPAELRAVIGAAGVRAVNYHGQSVASPTLEFRIAAPTPQTPSQVSQGSKSPQETGPVFGPLPPWELPATPRI